MDQHGFSNETKSKGETRRWIGFTFSAPLSSPCGNVRLKINSFPGGVGKKKREEGEGTPLSAFSSESVPIVDIIFGCKIKLSDRTEPFQCLPSSYFVSCAVFFLFFFLSNSTVNICRLVYFSLSYPQRPTSSNACVIVMNGTTRNFCFNYFPQPSLAGLFPSAGVPCTGKTGPKQTL